MPNLTKSSKLIFLVLTLLTLAIYWPAMTGPFLFDDFLNLNSLQKNGGIDSFQKWIDFVFGGGSSFLGRPLALASFTLNAQNWPADPFSFKVTNILIHCLNGWLVFIFLEKLTSLYNQYNAIKINRLVPVIGAAIWVIHPIHLTTVLQVVQRMTLLGSTFTLMSLILYINYLNQHKLALHKPFALLIIFQCTLGALGILSKETAILTPLFMFAINYTILRPRLAETPKFSQIWQTALLLGPLLAFLLGTLYLDKQLEYLWSARDFTLVERVLTESRILFQYLSSIFLPKVSGSGLFHDDLIISKDMLTPISTLFSVLSIIFLLLLSIFLRKSRPFFSLAILWFMLGHVFESTIWPLELYFEHRNYLPALCLVFVLIEISLLLASKPEKLFNLLSGFYLLIASAITALATPIWGDKLSLFTNWANENPNSIRAQHNAAATWLYEYDDPIKARTFLIQALKVDPLSISTRIRLIESYCYFDRANSDLIPLVQGLSEVEPDGSYLIALSTLIALKENKQCDTLSPGVIINVLDILQGNSKVSNAAGSWLQYHKARILLVAQKYAEALNNAETASKTNPFLATTILKIEIALKTNDIDLAKKFLNEANQLEKEQFYLLNNQQVEKYQQLKSALTEN